MHRYLKYPHKIDVVSLCYTRLEKDMSFLYTFAMEIVCIDASTKGGGASLPIVDSFMEASMHNISIAKV